ncbi:hypothetical protein [Paraglaciecola polaris]|uniref:DUF4397 domain-containing protein n=1 Tax=Paraglaciecola polaris LMG 21857 TaxID=1129793 RepID=K6YK45_9ALTE|nr:hypothetical protein [Paraglaciecola polaris]GAC33084.1 hypothetical protein GPLA_2179 [Paraglaciecola polaris LMG 21857]
MKLSKTTSSIIRSPALYIGLAVLSLTGCGSSDDDSTGYIRFYNASYNAPAVYLTVDEDLDEDDDDEVEITYSSVQFGSVTSNNALDNDTYWVELGWQDEESNDRSDLEVIYQEQHKIKKDYITFVALTDDIRDPTVLTFDIPVVDDDDDDLFNLRFLNLNTNYASVDVYMSEDNETFNEAEFVSTVELNSLTDNIKVEQDQYIFYITEPGGSEPIFTSEDISYSVVSQYVVALRDNVGVGSSPFTIDSIGTNSVTELNDVDSEASFGFYNGIATNRYIPDYSGVVDLNVDLIDDSKLKVEDLAYGEFSNTTTTSNGDYSFDIYNADNDTLFIHDALLSLEENADNMVFIYAKTDAIDDDEDDIIDENEDGIVDDYESIIKSITITKSTSSSIYSHGIKVVNLSDSDDFSRVKFYFVESDEVISTADNTLSVLQESNSSISLINNTYSVYAIATIEDTDIIMDSFQLTLDEDSVEQFLIFEADDSSSTGFRMTLVNQNQDN